jgi:hypothetical protein
LTYGETEKITVTFLDDTSKQITCEEIENYADESLNNGNEKNDKLVAIELPNENLASGIIYVDTPGVGGLNPLHGEATLSFLPYADVVLFVSDTVAPLQTSELEFLNIVKDHCQNFIFVLTKTDNVADYEQILQSNREKIAKYTDLVEDSIVNIPVSAETMLVGLEAGENAELIESSNIPALSAAIWDNVVANREQIILEPTYNSAISILNDISEELLQRDIGLSGSKAAHEELLSKINTKEVKVRELQINFSKLRELLQKSQRKLDIAITRRISTYRTDASGDLRDMLYPIKRIEISDITNRIGMVTQMAHIEIMELIDASIRNTVFALEDATQLSLRDGVDVPRFELNTVPEIQRIRKGVLGTILHTISHYGKHMLPNFYIFNMFGLGPLGLLWGILKGFKSVNNETVPLNTGRNNKLHYFYYRELEIGF